MDAAAHENNRADTDDYVNHTARLGYQFTPTTKTYIGIEGEYLDTIDPRGTGAAEGGNARFISFKPDEWHHYKISGNLAYGADSTPAKIALLTSYTDKQYDNNRAITFVRDRQDTIVNPRFTYRFMPKTEVLIDGIYKNIDYDSPPPGLPSLDSDEYTILAGLKWEATYKTSGSAQIGYRDRNFDAVGRSDDDDFSWKVGIIWEPRTYSTFSLESASEYGETNGTGDVIDTDRVSFNWNHQWLERLKTSVGFTYANDDFPGDNTGRQDDRYLFNADVGYEMRRWLEVGAGYFYDERDSNNNSFDYDRNVFHLFATIAL